MIILKLLSRLLDYPSEDLILAKDELLSVIDDCEQLSAAHKQSLCEFVCSLCEKDIFDLQERYDLLFDRGRSLSLLLFEHVHGESRDRGQAMVDLMQVYKSKGFEVNSSQLPDYLPLYLEFLSEQEPEYAKEWLADIAHLMTMLSERLQQRECNYQIIFDCLIELSGVEVDRAEAAEQVAKEERDDTLEAIDKAWEDKEIRFDDPMTAGCNATPGQMPNNQIVSPLPNSGVPIKWLNTENSQRTAV